MYTRDMYYNDINRIMYSRYYSALNEKQHGCGIITESDFLDSKEIIASSILGGLGRDDNSYLKVLLYADSLAVPPYGTGGAEVFREQFGYNQEEQTLKIIQELGLSEEVISEMQNAASSYVTTEMGIVRALRAILANSQGMTEEMEQVISLDMTRRSTTTKIGIAKDLYLELNSPTLSPKQQADIEKQKIDMQRAITALRERGFQGDIIKHILGKKESSLI